TARPFVIERYCRSEPPTSTCPPDAMCTWWSRRGGSRSRSPISTDAAVRTPARRSRTPASRSPPPRRTPGTCPAGRSSPSPPPPARCSAATPCPSSPRSGRRWWRCRTCCARPRPRARTRSRAPGSRSTSSTTRAIRSSGSSTSSRRPPVRRSRRARRSPSRSSDRRPRGRLTAAPRNGVGGIGGVEGPEGSAAREHLRDQERQLERLLMVQARVHERLVAPREPLLVDLTAAAEHLGDVVPGELHVQPARDGPQRLVHPDEPEDLAEDVLEAARLVAVGGGDGVAVH